ncbi:hypothetical protein A4X09_0g7115 [Tilletia walkeri]|uniref:Uncharacterized protein n=1 Tax=Tilletia walkeri TaxID=117179 RepID=A0A8X7N3S0_9BASI|nr:hypothetical protein A4X09_0g7115 [Tilletia walkeri]
MGVIPAGCCGTVEPVNQRTDDKRSPSAYTSHSDPDAVSLEKEVIKIQARLARYEVFVLEAGIIFLSVMIGVSIGTSSGPGSRIAILPDTSLFAKFLMYTAFSVITPLGVAIGIGTRQSYISAGIMIYSAMVQILADDFVYNKAMLTAPLRRSLSAFVLFTLGATVMSILGKWA